MKRFALLLLLFMASSSFALANKVVLGPEGTPGVLAVFPNSVGYRDYVDQFRTRMSGFGTTIPTGFLGITSSPNGAEVFLDGQYVGKTQVAAKVIARNYSVRLKAPGYADYDTVTVVPPQSEQNLDVTMLSLTPSGSYFPIPVDDLSDQIGPNSGFRLDAFLQDAQGSLFIVYHAPHYVKKSYVDYADTSVSEVFNVDSIGIAKSEDRGKTWTSVKKILGTEPPASVLSDRKPFSYAWTRTERGYDARLHKYVDVTCVTRYDNTAVFVDRESDSLFFDSATIDGDGHLRVLYEDMRTVNRGFNGIIAKVTTQAGCSDAYGSSPKTEYWTYLPSKDRELANLPSDFFATSIVSQSRSVMSASDRLAPQFLSFAPKSNASFGFAGSHGDAQYLVNAMPDASVQLYSLEGNQFKLLKTGTYSTFSRVLIDPAGRLFNLDASTGKINSLDSVSGESVGLIDPSFSLWQSTPVFDSHGDLHHAYLKYVAGGTDVYYVFAPIRKSGVQAAYLFTQPDCADCGSVKAWLDANEVSYSENPSLTGNLNKTAMQFLAAKPYPLLLVDKSDGTTGAVWGLDLLSASRELELSIPMRIGGHARVNSLFAVMTPQDLPAVIVQAGDGIFYHSYESGVWTEKKLADKPAVNYFFGPKLRGNGIENYNAPDGADDVELVVLTDFRQVNAGLTGYEWGTDFSKYSVSRDAYTLFTSRIKDLSSGETQFTNVLTAQLPPADAVIRPNKPYALGAVINGKGSLITIAADKETFLVSKDSGCAGRKNCLIFNPTDGSLNVKLAGGARVTVDDTLSRVIRTLAVEPITDSSALFFSQQSTVEPRPKVTLKFGKQYVQTNCRNPDLDDCNANFPRLSQTVIRGFSYAGDLTALTADIDFSSFENDYESETVRIHSSLSKKAYLMMNVKRMRGIQPDRLAYLTQNELIYLLQEAEGVADSVYSGVVPNPSSAIAMSKSQYARMYYNKDHDNPVQGFAASLFSGGTSIGGSVVLRMKKIDPYFPGDSDAWIDDPGYTNLESRYIDSEDTPVSFNHIFAGIAVMDVPETELANWWRTAGFSYLGDRGFSIMQFNRMMILGAWDNWGANQDVMNSYYSKSMVEAPLSELIADFYVLQFRRPVRENPAVRLSELMERFSGSEAQKRSKQLAFRESNAVGPIWAVYGDLPTTSTP